MSTLGLCMLLLVTGIVVNLQAQRPHERSNIGSCQKLTRDDLGRSDVLSAAGLVVQALQEVADGSVEVRIVGFNMVCEAAGLMRDTISSISVILTYECVGTVCGSMLSNRTEQFQLDCFKGLDVDGASFRPPRLAFGGNIRTQDPNGTLDTPLDEQCGQCAAPDGIPTDPSTHCWRT